MPDDTEAAKLTWSGPLRVRSENHCEACGEVIHNHFDCPICERRDAGSTCYMDLAGEPAPILIGCEECGAEFTTDAVDAYAGDTVWTRIITPGKMDHG
jgi:transcription elongation factor Elf1